MIELQHLRKQYESATPLKDVNVTINEGDVIAVIGPSGTGKSTLLRCINLLDTPTSGKVIVDGEDITDPRCDINRIRTRLGMVFQSFNLYEHLTVLENCMLAQTVLLKRSRQEAYQKAMELLASVGMDTRALQYPSQLSGGQKQRVAIARTLSTDPEIVLFDEPTSALDPLTIGEVEAVIEKLAQRGCTMMIVTHGMDFARNISNRVFYMDQGGIYEDGPPEQVFDNPKRDRTRRFVKRLACLEMQVSDHNHNLHEELGKILSFGSEKGIDPKRVMNACSAYEEICSFVFRTLLAGERSMNVSVEYSAADDSLAVSITPDALIDLERAKELIPSSLEYKLIRYYSEDLHDEPSDEGAGVRYILNF